MPNNDSSRIIQLGEATDISSNDYVLLDHPTLGFRKYKAVNLGGGGGGDIYKYHWSNDGKICVREGLGEYVWFFVGYTKETLNDIEPPEELVDYFPAYCGVDDSRSVIFGQAYATESSTTADRYIGFYNNKIRTWNSDLSQLISGTFYGVIYITPDTDVSSNPQTNEYTSPTDVPISDITLIEKTITENGTYSAEDDGYVGYSDVSVNVPVAKVFTGYNQIFKESGMDIRIDPNGKFKSIWTTGDSRIGCTIQGHTNLIGNYNNINIKGSITDSSEYTNKYGYTRTQFVVGVTGAEWQTIVLVDYNDYGDVYKKEVVTLTDQQVVNDINIDIDLNELEQQGYQSAYLLISLLGISGEFEVTIT